jgi:type II secretory pathway pseudopilin PulG
MKNNPGKFGRTSLDERPPATGALGFTLTELVVVVGVITLLTVTLLPALAGSKFRDQLAMCTANCRQWGVGMMTYASDHRDYFPAGTLPATAGGDPWDVANSFLSDMAAYGVNNPKTWFCPVRPWTYAGADTLCRNNLNHPLMTITNDVAYLFAYNGKWPGPDFEQMASSWLNTPGLGTGAGYEPWVKRPISGGGFFPSIYTTSGVLNPNRNSPYEWLQKSSDPHAAVMPILTDIIVSLSGYHNPSTLNAVGLKAVGPGQGHPAGGSQNGMIQSDNLTFGDGHVETHQASQIFWRYPANGANYTSFY